MLDFFLRLHKLYFTQILHKYANFQRLFDAFYATCKIKDIYFLLFTNDLFTKTKKYKITKKSEMSEVTIEAFESGCFLIFRLIWFIALTLKI